MSVSCVTVFCSLLNSAKILGAQTIEAMFRKEEETC
jgi:hypothetical protein